MLHGQDVRETQGHLGITRNLDAPATGMSHRGADVREQHLASRPEPEVRRPALLLGDCSQTASESLTVGGTITPEWTGVLLATPQYRSQRTLPTLPRV